MRRRRRLVAALAGFALGSVVVEVVGGSSIIDIARGTPPPAPVVIELPTPSVEDKLRSQLAFERHRLGARINNVTVQNRALRTQLRIERRQRAWAGRDLVAESRLAVRTVAWLTGVPERVANNIAHCESRFRPWAQRPGSQYVGTFQLGRNFHPGPFLPSAAAARHPWLNAAAALTVIARQGDRQWECSGLTGRPKPNYPANSSGWRP